MVPAVPTGGITVPNNSTIQLAQTGVYEALYHVLPVEESRAVRLFMNGAEIAGSRNSNHTSGAVIDGKLMFTVAAGDIPATIQLVNWVNGPLTYEAFTAFDVTAMLSIKKLSD